MINSNLTKFKLHSPTEAFSSSKKNSSVRSFHSSNNYNNSLIHEKPLKENSISFKGFSLRLMKILPAKDISKTVEHYGKELSEKQKNYLTDVIGKLAKAPLNKKENFIKEITENGIKKYVIKDRTVWNETLRSLAYPFVNLPRDTANGLISIFVRKPEVAAKVRNNIPYLKLNERLNFINNTNLRDSVLGYFEDFAKKPNDIFNIAHKRMDPLKGNFQVSIERFLNRWESGIPSMLFLGNDMYNLTRLMSDNHKEANKEKNGRIKQEFGRLVLTSALTLFSLNALRKLTNKSFGWALGVSLGSVLIGETVGRLITGKRILPITKEQAAKEAQFNKENTTKKITRTDIANKLFNSFNQTTTNDITTSNNKENDNKIKVNANLSKKTNLPVSTKIALAIASWTALSVGIFKFGNFSTNHNYKVLNSIKKNYDGFVNALVRQSKIKNEKLIEILEKQNQNDSTIAKKYINQISKFIKLKQPKGFEKFDGNNLLEYLKTMEKGKRIPVGENPLLKEVYSTTVEFPVKLALNFPLYIGNMFTKLAGHLVKNEKLKKGFLPDPQKTPQNISQNFVYWMKNDNLNKQSSKIFDETVAKTYLSSFNKSNTQDYSTTDMGNWNKLLASAISGVFLVSDNYNHVMLKTKGEDKSLASQKAQERAIQEVSRNFFSTYIVKVFNDCLKSWSNSNLVYAGMNTVLNVGVYETFTRMAVGLPVKPSSREEIIELERKNETKKGFAGSYFRFMSYVTGKKSLSSRINKTNEHTLRVPKTINLAERKNNTDFSSAVNSYINSNK